MDAPKLTINVLDLNKTVTAWGKFFTQQSGHPAINRSSSTTYNESWTGVIWNAAKASNVGGVSWTSSM